MSSSYHNNVREPSEVEAWKLMMDSMIKFIAASTKLMRTITNRAEAATPVESSVFPKCEVECIMCPTGLAKECVVCAAAASVVKGQGDKPSKIPVKSRDSSPSGIPPAIVTKNADEVPTTEETEESPKEQDEVSAKEPIDESPSQAEQNVDEGKGPEVSSQSVGEVGKPSAADIPREVGDKSNCVCKEIRQIKKEAAKAGVDVKKKPCACSGKIEKCGGSQGALKQGASQKTMCACDIGPNEKEQLTNELANKLNMAQENIFMLQMEMSRIQQLDASKNSQSAALYKEIMKDTSLGREEPSNVSAVSSGYQPQNPNLSRVTHPGTPPPPSQTDYSARGASQGVYDKGPCTNQRCPKKIPFPGFSPSTEKGSLFTSSGIASYPTGLQDSSYPSCNEGCTGISAQQRQRQAEAQFQSLGTNKAPTVNSGFSEPTRGQRAPPLQSSYSVPGSSQGQRSQASAYSSTGRPPVQRLQAYPTSRPPQPFAYSSAGVIPGAPQGQRWPVYQATRPEASGYRSQGMPAATQGQKVGAPAYPPRANPADQYRDPKSNKQNPCQGSCYKSGKGSTPVGDRAFYDTINTAFIQDEVDEDYLNQNFTTDSREFTGEECYDGNCDSDCY